MGSPRRLVVVRHGESVGNLVSPDDISTLDCANHRFELTEQGCNQSRKTGDYLRSQFGNFDAYFVSTFLRTQQSLGLMYPEARPIVDSRLNELWRGIWHTLPKEVLQQRYPEEQAVKLREGWYHYRPPGGQSCTDVELMIYSYLADLREQYADKSVLISAHGNWAILLWRILEDKTPDEAEYRYAHNRFHNASITMYERRDSRLKLVLDNFLPE